MARRSKKDIQGALLLAALVIGGIGWLFNQGAAALNGPMGDTIAIAFAVTLVSIVSFLLLRKCLAALRRRRVQRSLLKKVNAAMHEHLAALTRKRMQLVQPDAYGNPKLEKWTEAIKYFLFDHLGPSLSPEEQYALSEIFPALAMTIDSFIQDAMRNHPSFRAFSDDMSPAEFEGFCAEELRQSGWNARVTLQSRDQGVDVVADKNNVSIVLQCKLYAGPVGNKAVQEATAGRAHRTMASS